MTITNSADIDRIVSSMSLEEKIGQVVIPCFQSSTISKDIETAVSKIGVGVIRYSPNANFDNNSNIIKLNENLSPVQTAELLNDLQKLAQKTKCKIPLIVSVDQEGGSESDLNRGGITVFPGQMGFGAIDDPDITMLAATIMGRELKAVGIMLNQAIALDVVGSNTHTTVKTLTFGDSTELVSRLGVAFLRGFKAGGVATMAKHFPSYGASAIDAHKGMATITKSREQLQKEDLKPYKDVISAGLDAIMVGHVITECLDSSSTPASLSGKIIRDVLRKEIGFGGILQTDALRMKAIIDRYGVGNAAVMAMQAGCDLILLRGDFPHFEEGYNAISRAFKHNKIPESQLNESVRRILALKFRLGLFANPFVNPKEVEMKVGTKEHREVSLQVARRSVTLVRNRKGLIPLAPDSSMRLLVISSQSKKLVAVNDPIQSVDMLIRALKKLHPNTTGHITSTNPAEQEIAKAIKLAEKADVTVLGTCNAILNKEQSQLVKKFTSTGKPLIVIAMESPYDLVEFPDIDNYLCTYGDSNDSMIAASEIIFGKIKPVGKLPITLPV